MEAGGRLKGTRGDSPKSPKDPRQTQNDVPKLPEEGRGIWLEVSGVGGGGQTFRKENASWTVLSLVRIKPSEKGATVLCVGEVGFGLSFLFRRGVRAWFSPFLFRVPGYIRGSPKRLAVP